MFKGEASSLHLEWAIKSSSTQVGSYFAGKYWANIYYETWFLLEWETSVNALLMYATSFALKH